MGGRIGLVIAARERREHKRGVFGTGLAEDGAKKRTIVVVRRKGFRDRLS